MFFKSIISFFQSIVKYFKSIFFKDTKTEVLLLLSPEEKYIKDIDEKFQQSYENKIVEWSDNIYEEDTTENYFKNKSQVLCSILEKKWKSRILFEPTPRGNIIMMYDTYTEAFVYYIDTSGTPYKLLNAVAMKYVLTFRCRDFFVDENKIPDGMTTPFIKNLNLKEEQEKNKKVTFFNELTNGVPEDSPFAKLKSRNVSEKIPKKETEIQKIKIQNRFISQGKISNYRFLQKGVSTKKRVNIEATYKSHKQDRSTKPDYSDNGTDICSLLDF